MKPRPRHVADGTRRPELEGKPKASQRPPGPTAKFDLKLEHIVDELGGIASLMDLARQCGDEKVRKVAAQWEALGGREKATASLDQLCEEAGIKAGHFLGQLMAYCWKWNLNAAKLIVSQAMPGIMQKTVERALESDGFRDRKMVMEHVMPAYAPRTHPAPVLRGQVSKTPGSDQNEGSLDYPRVEEDNAVDRIFRDLDGE